MGEKDKKGANVSRRDFLRTLGAVGGSLALHGLSPRMSFAQAEKYGGILRISGNYGLTSINPIMHTSIGEWAATKLMYNNLVRMSYKREVVPDLAEILITKEIERIRALAEGKQSS